MGRCGLDQRANAMNKYDQGNPDARAGRWHTPTVGIACRVHPEHCLMGRRRVRSRFCSLNACFDGFHLFFERH
jgi:hypothetical protein